MKGIFITGTSTGVGKTWIGSQLVKHLYESGIKVTPQKPIESGCVLKSKELFAEDANKYFIACKGSTPEHQITPFRYSQICSPARASLLNNKPLYLNQVTQHINKTINDDSFAVIEGAGGFYSPLAIDALNADLASAINLPIILIAEDILGCINTILLSLKAIEESKLTCIAIIINKPNENKETDTNNEKELKSYTHIPIITNQFQSNDAIEKLIKIITELK